MRKTKILAWTEDWSHLYSSEEKIIKEVFMDDIIEIHHIGSTSIPTIGYAKPIIDMLLVVKDIHNVDLYNSEMLTRGYEPKGENGIAGRRYFTKGKEYRTHHLHIYQIGSEQIKTHLDFKEYLLKHPEEAHQYGQLKVNLVKQFPNEHHKYQEGKQPFVHELVNKAKVWASQQRS